MRNVSHGQQNEPFLEYILALLRIRQAKKYIYKGSVIIDLGCGYKASFLTNVRNIIKSGYGFDVSVNKKGIYKNIILKELDLNNPKSPPKIKADIVTALAVLEHVENPVEFLKFARKLLKPNGQLIITTPDKKLKPILEFLSYKMKLISREEINDHKNYFDKKSLHDLLKKAGLKNIKVTRFEMGLNLSAVAVK